MSRIHAAAVHLAFSVAIGLTFFLLFWFVWYPAPLFVAVGGHELFLMLLGIDVTLGPLLTLIVFRSGKTSLRFDLAVIAIVQVIAMAYGVGTLLVGRPVYIAALGHRFDLIQAHEVAPDDLQVANVKLPWFGPIVTGTKSPSTQKERENFMFGGADLGSFPQYQVPIRQMRNELLKHAEPITRLKQLNAGHEKEIDSWLLARGYDERTAVFQGLKARNLDMVVILDKRDAKVIGIAGFRPWQ